MLMLLFTYRSIYTDLSQVSCETYLAEEEHSGCQAHVILRTLPPVCSPLH